MFKQWWRGLTGLVLISLGIFACGTQSVMMKVMRPAEINLKNYQKIALGDFVNPSGKIDRHARDVRDAFTQQLLATGRFEVVDRQSLDKILEEQKLGISGLIDEQSAPQLGKLLGASALIFGRITTDQFRQELRKEKPYKDKKGKTHQRQTRLGQYDFGVFIKIVDVQTGKIIFSKEITANAKKQNSALDKTPPPIDRNQLYRECLNKISNRFRKMIAPYQTTVKAQFLVDDKIPATKKAVAFFKAGEWQKGLQLLRKATQQPLKNKLKAKVYYDLGLAQMYLGAHDEAIQNIRQAVQLQPSEKRYQKALRTAKQEKQRAEKLKEQL